MFKKQTKTIEDLQNEWLKKYNYEWVSDDDWRWRKTRMRVASKNLIGVVDYENRILLSIEYDRIQISNSYYYCQKNNTLYIFKCTPDIETKFILLNTLPIIKYNSEYLSVRVEEYFGNDFYRIMGNEGDGFCDKSGAITVPPYFRIYETSRKYPWVFATTDNDNNFYLINRNGLISPLLKNSEIIINSGFHKGCRGRVIDIATHKEYNDYHDETYIDYQLTIQFNSTNSIKIKIGTVDIIPAVYETINEYIRKRQDNR